MSHATVTDGLLAWAPGLAFIVYDTVLIAIVLVATLPLLRPTRREPPTGERESLGVIIAARDEAAALPMTLSALLAQADPPDAILIADDGSRDVTPTVLAAFGLQTPAIGGLAVSAVHSNLRWLRLPHGGKARALNAALLALDTSLVVTVDGDTLLHHGALGAMRRAFAAEPRLVAAAGMLAPVCGPSSSGRVFQLFQTTEYIRNFLTRYAWHRMDALLLISGAFAGFRRDALIAVGGFDPACMVEDYELIHRLRRYGADKGLGWTTAVIGGARAVTEAPSTVSTFLRQRRRWFCGFLQTQLWYRDMVGDPRYGRVGLVMLPIKAFDTLQPLYWLVALTLLLADVLTGRTALLAPILAVIAAKMSIDAAFQLWSLRLYRRWVDPDARVPRAFAVATLVEPFSFQVLRQLGPALGWLSFLTGDRAWRRHARVGLVAVRDSDGA